MKNNIDFYRHDVNAHSNAKIKMLRIKYGWAGEGKFWALNGIIGQAENCEFNIGKKFNKAHLCSELDFSMKELDEFVKYLIDDCELLLVDNNFISTNDVQEILERVMKERNRCKSKRKQGPTEGRPSINQGQNKKDRGQISQSKVKESKVKKSKYNTNVINIFEYYKKIIKPDSRYNEPSMTKKFIKELLREYSEKTLLECIDNYKRLKEKEYTLKPSNFFSNSHRKESYRKFENYLPENVETIEKETEEERLKKAGYDPRYPIIN